MENIARLIHKSYMTYLPTNLQAQFFGLPDGKIYVIYARFYDIKLGNSGIEYVFAEHLEFSYDYESNKLVSNELIQRKLPIYIEMVDKPEPKIKILKVYRTINSFAEAHQKLNKKAFKMLGKLNKGKTYQQSENNLFFNQSLFSEKYFHTN